MATRGIINVGTADFELCLPKVHADFRDTQLWHRFVSVDWGLSRSRRSLRQMLLQPRRLGRVSISWDAVLWCRCVQLRAARTVQGLKIVLGRAQPRCLPKCAWRQEDARTICICVSCLQIWPGKSIRQNELVFVHGEPGVFYVPNFCLQSELDVRWVEDWWKVGRDRDYNN